MPQPAPLSSPILAIPSVRRLAKEYKIDLSEIKATGKKGRILKEDVLKYLSGRGDVSEEIQQSIAPGLVRSRIDRSESLTPFQKGMVKTMTEALVSTYLRNILRE